MLNTTTLNYSVDVSKIAHFFIFRCKTWSFCWKIASLGIVNVNCSDTAICTEIQFLTHFDSNRHAPMERRDAVLFTLCELFFHHLTAPATKTPRIEMYRANHPRPTRNKWHKI